MLTAIFTYLTSGGARMIFGQITRAYEMKLKAKNNKDRIEADKTIAQLEGQQAVLIAEQGHWMTRWIRPLFALPFIIFNFKVIVWDKVLGWGVTDDLSSDMWKLQMVVFGAYFLARPFEKFGRRRH